MSAAKMKDALKNLAALVSQHQSKNTEEKEGALIRLMSLGSSAVPGLVQLLEYEEWRDASSHLINILFGKEIFVSQKIGDPFLNAISEMSKETLFYLLRRYNGDCLNINILSQIALLEIKTFPLDEIILQPEKWDWIEHFLSTVSLRQDFIESYWALKPEIERAVKGSSDKIRGLFKDFFQDVERRIKSRDFQKHDFGEIFP